VSWLQVPSGLISVQYEVQLFVQEVFCFVRIMITVSKEDQKIKFC